MAAPAEPDPVETSCTQLLGGQNGALVKASDAEDGCLDPAGVRLYPTLRECTDGRQFVSLEEPRTDRYYFGFVGKPWKTVPANPQNFAALEAARHKCSGT